MESADNYSRIAISNLKIHFLRSSGFRSDPFNRIFTVDPVNPVILYMADHHNKKRFLNLPKYIGGSEAFKKFIAENLRYPEAALESKTEGSVIVEYDISDDGLVYNPHVLKGLGYGCDEEALRLISLLRFEKVKNRGVRVKMTTKTTIHFRLPGVNISYSTPEKHETEKKDDGPVTYTYTITL